METGKGSSRHILYTDIDQGYTCSGLIFGINGGNEGEAGVSNSIKAKVGGNIYSVPIDLFIENLEYLVRRYTLDLSEDGICHVLD